MSRRDDIEFIEHQIQELATQRQQVATDFTAYFDSIRLQIEKALKDAGIFDLVQTLEMGREKRKVDDQARADELGKKIGDLDRVRAFLLAREGSPALSPAPESQPSPVKNVEIVNGVDVSDLDRETRLMVESGNQETIEAVRRRTAPGR